MAKVEVRADVLQKLKGKTVIITGGSNGIGRETTLLLCKHGATVVIGDIDIAKGEELFRQIEGVGLFQKTDVSDWKSLRSLFAAAKEKFGRIDAVIANAAIPERGPPFLLDSSFDDDGQLSEPKLDLVDVNLNGALRTTKLAMHYFALNSPPGGSLVMTGSAASFFASPPIILYGAAKHALLGILRSVSAMSKPCNVRVNLVAPWMTETEFSSEVVQIWGDLPKNTAREVAEALCIATVDEKLHGRALYVAKEIVDFELPLHENRELWMSKKQAEWFETGRERLAVGMSLPSQHHLDGQ